MTRLFGLEGGGSEKNITVPQVFCPILVRSHYPDSPCIGSNSRHMIENTYLQFPLCALSFGQTEKGRLNAILDYAVVEAGSKLFSKLTINDRNRFLFIRNESGDLPSGFDANCELHVAALYGARCLGVTYRDVRSLIESHDSLVSHVSKFESRHGRDPTVRIRTEWLFDVRDARGLTYREFSVLCAIFSVIGKKTMAKVTQLRIRRRALGYRSLEILVAEMDNRPDKARALTVRQAKDTIARLHCNRFFSRCTVARRFTFYSIRLSDEELRKKLLEKYTYPARFRAQQSAKDKALTAAIKRSREEAKKDEHRD